jgi:hypothetical protein
LDKTGWLSKTGWGGGVSHLGNVGRLLIAGVFVKQEEPVSMQGESMLKTFLLLVVWIKSDFSDTFYNFLGLFDGLWTSV